MALQVLVLRFSKNKCGVNVCPWTVVPPGLAMTGPVLVETEWS
jgi:hypothetical protein